MIKILTKINKDEIIPIVEPFRKFLRLNLGFKKTAFYSGQQRQSFRDYIFYLAKSCPLKLHFKKAVNELDIC